MNYDKWENELVMLKKDKNEVWIKLKSNRREDENYLIYFLQIAMKEIRKKIRNKNKDEIIKLKHTNGDFIEYKVSDLEYFINSDDSVELNKISEDEYILTVDTRARRFDEFLLKTLFHSLVKIYPALKNMYELEEKKQHVRTYLDVWKNKIKGVFKLK